MATAGHSRTSFYSIKLTWSYFLKAISSFDFGCKQHTEYETRDVGIPTNQQFLRQQSQPQQSNNNKRKALDEALSPERTKPRYRGITTVV
ncbi:hypothetical protein Scep_016937 [Stephania cephalantha]|uniref:Uncharacterized protein n=1 Tax=Stephania cephalantha TaxID=152367 RepID=A0AAP0INI4_9MAGN